MFTSTSPSADSVSKLASRAGQLMTPSPHCPHPFIVYHIHFNLLSNIRTAFSHYVVQFHDVFFPSTSTSTRQKGREGTVSSEQLVYEKRNREKVVIVSRRSRGVGRDGFKGVRFGFVGEDWSEGSDRPGTTLTASSRLRGVSNCSAGPA
jgi:hypothetical protein